MPTVIPAPEEVLILNCDIIICRESQTPTQTCGAARSSDHHLPCYPITSHALGLIPDRDRSSCC